VAARGEVKISPTQSKGLRSKKPGIARSRKTFALLKPVLRAVEASENEVYVNHPLVMTTGGVLAVDFRDVSGQVNVDVNLSSSAIILYSSRTRLYIQTLTNTRANMKG
jgi:hypothetical protein